ncbi:MAG: phosphatase PAP2 family protein [Saprospirales bacterium]|nr:phosphatase PAP2 family protein [Saprospirales bacterium]
MCWLETLDITLFYWINVSGTNPVFDVVLPLCREKWFWSPLYLFVGVFAIQNYSFGRGVMFLSGLILVVGLSDFTSSSIVKKNIQRLRPCIDPELHGQVIQRVPCGSGYSFTSSHAANHFAAAVYLSLLLGNLARWVRPVLIAWAALVAYAQVYVGVHYPGDVLGGALLGTGIACYAVFVFRKNGWLPAI